LVRCTTISFTGAAAVARSATIATVMTSSISVKPRRARAAQVNHSRLHAGL